MFTVFALWGDQVKPFTFFAPNQFCLQNFEDSEVFSTFSFPKEGKMFTRIQVFFGKDKGWWGSDGHHHQFGQWVRQPDRWLNLDMKHHHYERRCAVCGAVFQSTFGDDQKYLGVPKGGKE